MSTCAITANNTPFQYHPTQTEYINTLIKENEQLKILNNKLYKRTLNLKRKNLRLKNFFNVNNLEQTNKTKINDLDDIKQKNKAPNNEDNKENDDSDNNEPIITDVIWEDVNDLIQSYEIEDKINQVAEKLVEQVLNDSKEKTE